MENVVYTKPKMIVIKIEVQTILAGSGADPYTESKPRNVDFESLTEFNFDETNGEIESYEMKKE